MWLKVNCRNFVVHWAIGNLILIAENYLIETLLQLHNSLEHDLFQESKFRIATTWVHSQVKLYNCA